ncbi:DUF2971 domain-containing protein [Vibrio metschnikovii]|uniref:DUF2971 domain-containing protein n=1 Tax=Vibrio metschnikovii TaxID=28172 RepID=UPI002FC76B09
MIQILGNITLPDVLYKYRDWSLEFHRAILKEKIAFFSSPADFNDPFDCKIPIRYDIKPEKQLEDIYFNVIKAVYKNYSDGEIRAFAKKQVSNGIIDPKLFKKNDKEYFDNLAKRMGVFSTSKYNDDILMWGHYANSHKGFCLGLSTNELMKSKDIDFIGQVNYSPDFPVIIPNGNSEDLFEKQIFSKWDKWSYEGEYRLTKNHIQDRKIELPSSCYKEIIFGYQMDKKDQNEIKEIVLEKFPTIEMYQAEASASKFMIKIKRIN